MNFEAKKNPKASVIIPVYNNESFIRETLDSVKNQTFTDFEVLCVDDGSSDGSAKIIQEYEASDKRFHYIFQKNSGAGPARNNGLSKARGEYISFLDGDDMYYPNYLEKMIDALDKTQADVCICEREVFNSKNGRIISKGTKYRKFEDGRIYYTQSLLKDYFGLMTVVCWNKVFRHAFLQKHPYEFQNILHCNDVAFVCSTMAAAETVCFAKERLVLYRKGTEESTQDKAVKYPLCALEAFDKARENIFILHENDIEWQKAIDTRCADAFFNTFQKDVKDDAACKEAYDAFKNKYEIKWKLREKPLRYFGNLKLRLRIWCYRRTSYEGMRKAYLQLQRERGKKILFFDLVKPYVVLAVSGFLKQ